MQVHRVFYQDLDLLSRHQWRHVTVVTRSRFCFSNASERQVLHTTQAHLSFGCTVWVVRVKQVSLQTTGSQNRNGLLGLQRSHVLVGHCPSFRFRLSSDTEVLYSAQTHLCLRHPVRVIQVSFVSIEQRDQVRVNEVLGANRRHVTSIESPCLGFCNIRNG
ncbi:hypothetical protein D3C87_1685240 [compost metagenome]